MINAPGDGDVFSGNFAGPVFTGKVDNRGGNITGGHLNSSARETATSLLDLLGRLRTELTGLAADTVGRQDALTKVDELTEQLAPEAPAQPERKALVSYLFGKLKSLVEPLKVGTGLVTEIAKLITVWHSML